MPTLEHFERYVQNLDFVIIDWAVNDAKNDLSYEEFVDLCKKVITKKDIILKKL